MKKSIVITLISLLLPALVCGGQETFRGRVSFGLEWGYCQNFYKFRHINIISQEGSRINENFSGFSALSGGTIMAGVGYDFSEQFRGSVHLGYAGISEGTRVYPALLRISFAPKGQYSEGIFTFLDAGPGFRTKPAEYDWTAVVMGDLGLGYRICLMPYSSLDLLLSIRAVYDRPAIDNPEGEGYVLPENIRSNVAEYYSLNFSIALSF